MLQYITSSRAGIVINITSSLCLTRFAVVLSRGFQRDNVCDPGSAVAIPVKHSIFIIHHFKSISNSLTVLQWGKSNDDDDDDDFI